MKAPDFGKKNFVLNEGGALLSPQVLANPYIYMKQMNRVSSLAYAKI